MKETLDRIYEYSLEEIMGMRFGSYSKYIIQDRAIPDARDGLKPVQRRIIYSMYKENNTYNKPYRKSAKTVGDVIGKYHPHGDTSIYDAMVRMSQDWRLRSPYIDMHGNNGSIDGDSPAAYRYTEARLSKISNELVRDIGRDTVEFAPNFDDSDVEPTVLPARFPNLLVNGSTGISSGYATNIPPHNLGEVIDATIKRIDSPNCTLETLMSIVKGPDFPTGGIVEGIDGIKKAYETGRGRIIIKSRCSFEEAKGKSQIIITEIPYEVNKAQLVRKIDEIRLDKKIDGIIEIRDESDRDGLRIAIDVKKEANKEVILNYLLKNTELQVSYNFNVIAIVNRAPRQLGLKDMLDSYISYQKEVITRRTRFDLEHAKARYHILEGLIRCISILDDVIKTIRASKNKEDAKNNLVKEYDFTMAQADAIVTLQLYRLTNTDITEIENELKELEKKISEYQKILSDENELKKVMKDELREIKKEYALARKTDIKDEITEIKIDSKEMIAKEDVIVQITKDGYIKRTSFRSYSASASLDITLKENDYVLGLYELNTLDVILLFTNLGNYLYIPVYQIPTLPWKDLGKHVSNIVKIEEGEEIIGAIPVTDFTQNKNIIIATSNGMIKKSLLSLFDSVRITKPICAIKLKDDDRVVAAFVETEKDIFISTVKGYGLWYDSSEIPSVGLKTSGVKSINLKDDVVASVSEFNADTLEYISVITEKKTGKRVKLSEFDKSSRAKRGLMILREVKSNPYKVVKTFTENTKHMLGLKTGVISYIKFTDLPIADRYSTGSAISKEQIIDAFVKVDLVKRDSVSKEESKVEDSISNEEVVKEEDSKAKERTLLKEIDDRLLTIEDFLNED